MKKIHVTLALIASLMLTMTACGTSSPETPETTVEEDSAAVIGSDAWSALPLGERMTTITDQYSNLDNFGRYADELEIVEPDSLPKEFEPIVDMLKSSVYTNVKPEDDWRTILESKDKNPFVLDKLLGAPDPQGNRTAWPQDQHFDPSSTPEGVFLPKDFTKINERLALCAVAQFDSNLSAPCSAISYTVKSFKKAKEEFDKVNAKVGFPSDGARLAYQTKCRAPFDTVTEIDREVIPKEEISIPTFDMSVLSQCAVAGWWSGPKVYN